MKNYRRLLTFVYPYRFRFYQALGCMALLAIANAAQMAILKEMVDEVFVLQNAKYLWPISIIIILLFTFKSFFTYLQTYLMKYVGQQAVKNIRNKLYAHIQSLSMSFFSKQPTGVLMSRITNDVGLTESALSDVAGDLLRETLTLVALTGWVFYLNKELALVTLVVVPIAIYPLINFGRKLRKRSHKSQQHMAILNTILHETIVGARVVKAFGMEQFEIAKFNSENRRFFYINMKILKVVALSSPLMEFIGGLCFACIFIYCGHLIVTGKMSAGTFSSFMVSVFMMYEPIKKLSRVNASIQQSLAAAQRIFAILDTKPTIVESPQAVEVSNVKEQITFENVTFAYEEKAVLKNINLAIKVGQIFAVVGVSGAGKTTLLNLLARFWDPQQGRICIDGIDLKEIKLASLREIIGIVTQETILFNDTVANNIAFGRSNTPFSEIQRAAQAANAHDFIVELPKGYHTQIGEMGLKLSGGQRQRIAIARAILKNPPILILDEATSALDSEAERLVQEALDHLMQGRTTLVVAHRLSTIQRADTIAVLHEGQVLEQGNHEQLLARQGLYARLYQMQFSSSIEALEEPTQLSV